MSLPRLTRDRDFLLFWSAQTVSQIGSQVTQLALPLVAVVTLKASTFSVGVLTGIEFVPWLIVSLPAGIWADRLPRRPLLMTADLGRAAVVASVPIAAAFGALQMWHLFAVAFVAGCLTVVFDVSYQSYIPTIAGRDRLIEGNARLEFTRSAAQIGGPGLAGALIALVTAPYALAADALSFVMSGALLGAIRREETRPEPSTRKMREEILSGLRIVLGDTRTRAIVYYVATSTFFNGVFFAVVLVFCVRTLGLSGGVIGVVLALANVGSLLGAVVAGRAGRALGIGRTLLAASFVSGLPLLLVALAPRSFPLPFLVLGLLFFGLGVIVYNITAISLIQTITPERYLGRANASRRFLVWGPIPLGAFSGGGIAAVIGVRQTVLLGALGMIAAGFWLLREPIRGIGSLETEPPVVFEEFPSPATIV